MVARAALIKPWIFREATRRLLGHHRRRTAGASTAATRRSRASTGATTITGSPACARSSAGISTSGAATCRATSDGTFPSMQQRASAFVPRSPLERAARAAAIAAAVELPDGAASRSNARSIRRGAPAAVGDSRSATADRRATSTERSKSRAAPRRQRLLALLQLLERPRPVVLEQPRQRAIGQQLAAGLAGRTVVRFVRGVANALHRRAAHRTRLAVAAVHGHPVAKRRHLLGKRRRRSPSCSRCAPRRQRRRPWSPCRRSISSSRHLRGQLHRRHLRRVQDLVRVGVADAAEAGADR